LNDSRHYHPHFSLLDKSGCERIHHSSLEILRRTGVRVQESEALKLLAEAGAHVSDGDLVKLPPSLLEWALSQAPSRIVMCRRGSDEVAVELSGYEVNFGPGSDCPNYLDPKQGRRLFTADDVAACVRLCDALPQIGFVMSMGIPSRVEDDSQYRSQYALMLVNTTKPAVFVANDRLDCEAIAAMAAAAAGGEEALRLNPTILLYSEPTTPLIHTRTATEKLLFMAEKRLPVVHSPAPMMGGTAPVTLAGGLALGNAEVLSSLLIHQLKQTGAPFVYGSGLHHLDMRTTISVYGAPEFQLARALVAGMGRFYGLPTWGYAGCSDALVMDGQAAADAAYQVRDALMMGTNLVHDVGYMEGGLTTSPEMIVLSAEFIEMHRRFMAGVEISDETLALDVIHDVGPGGDFISTDHTLSHFRDDWYPTLFERRRHVHWQTDGSQTLEDRLREKTIAIMDSHRPAPLPDAVIAEVEAIRHSAAVHSV
jgi:trimethylamine---corrinoid protein Co-methyltransferase